MILLDLSAAFDTIDFDILIERLISIGIGKVPIKWFQILSGVGVFLLK